MKGEHEDDYNILIDVHKEAFQQFLRFLYTGQIEITKDHVDDLIRIAVRYEMGELKNACESKLIDKLNKSNASEMFQRAHRYGFKGDLKKNSFVLVKQMLARCNQKLTDDMMEQPEKVLKSVNLGQELIQTVKEMTIKESAPEEEKKDGKVNKKVEEVTPADE